MFRKPKFIALALAGLLTVVVLNLPPRTAAQVKLAVGSLFLPLFGLSRASHQLAVKAEGAVIPRSDLERQNQQFRLANDQLQIRVMQGDAALQENARLRQLLAWKAQSPWRDRLLPAAVVARDPANWWQSAWIDRGSNDHLRPDLPVLTASGLVGRVVVVGLTRSQFLLVSNPNCPVAALIDKGRDGHETGVLKGSASLLDNSLVTLSFLSSNSSLKPGESVTTSGEGGIFPPGIPIGQIAEESRTVDFGLRSEARVKLSADLGTLEEVWVLLPP